MKWFAQGVVCMVSVCWLNACKDIPQAPPETVPTPVPSTTIVIDSQFNADYGGAIPYPSVIVSGTTTFGITYGMMELGKFRFAGCPIGCEERRNWVVGDLDTSGQVIVGAYSAAADDGGRLQTAYDRPMPLKSSLKYASCAALCHYTSSWSFTVVDTVGVTGYNVSMAAKLGRTHIAYITPGQLGVVSRLRYAACSGDCLTVAEWSSTTVDTGAYGDTQIAVDPMGAVHIVYQTRDSIQRNLVYARCAISCSTAANWQIFRIGGGARPSLAVDASGNLTLAYVEGFDEFDEPDSIVTAICAAGCASGAWQRADVLFKGQNVRDVSLAVGASGTTFIAYGATVPAPGDSVYEVIDYGILRLGHCSSNCALASSWQFLTVDSVRWYRPDHVSLALDSAGHAGIAHSNSGALRFSLIKADLQSR